MDARTNGQARSLVVVSAGLSQPSSTRLLADRLAAATARHLAEAGAPEPRIQVVELRDHAQDLVNNLLTGFPAARLRTLVDAVLAADGLIAVSPIFNASYSGLFKLFFDVLERDSLAGTPTLIAATGGTARHSLALEHALRPLFAYLNAAVVPTAVFAATEDWGRNVAAGESGATGGESRAANTGVDRDLVERIDRAAAELANAMLLQRRAAVRDEFADPTPFEVLLAARRPSDL